MQHLPSRIDTLYSLSPQAARGWGVSGTQLSQNFLQHTISSLQRVIVPQSDNPKAIRLKKRLSLSIARSRLCTAAQASGALD